MSGIIRHEVMEFMFEDPTIFEDLDVFFKDETARRLLFFHQVKTNMMYNYVINILA